MAPLAMKLLAAAGVPGALATKGLQASGSGGHPPEPAQVPLIVPQAAAPAASATKVGDDLMKELADVVLANKQELLPIPFEMILERDVGWVGEYPIMENATSFAKLESLRTVREVEAGLPPVVPIASVYLKHSDKPSTPPAAYRMGGSAGGQKLGHLNGVVNPTSETTVLGWQKIRYNAVKEWLDMWEGRRADYLVILHSNGDVLYGGCDESTIQYKFEQVVNASGGTQKIVVGAEVAPYPSDVAWYYAATPSIATTMASALETFGLETTWASAYANCTGEANSICDSVPKYGYANAGFIMGHAGEVNQMLSGLANYQGPENRYVNEYFIENQEKVALDYAGTLSMTLHNLVKDGAVPVEVVTAEAGGKAIQNKVTNKKVCFVHGNGNSFDALKVLATALTATPSNVTA